MKAQVHRFRDKVAVYVGNGDTVYLDPDTAYKLANALDDCAISIRDQPFTHSTFETREIELGDASHD